MTFNDFLIPVASGQAVSKGWTSVTGNKPIGVTWHWAATRTLAQCRTILGGANAERRGEASAHFCVGRTATEGIDRYVDVANRAWHAGINQTLDTNGRPATSTTKATRTTIGIETVNIGFARDGVPASADWIVDTSPNGKQVLRIQPWPEEQIDLMVTLARSIVARFPHIRPEHHHGHHDICPGYKLDVLGFPFADVLRRAYDDPSIPDVWSPWRTVRARQKALVDLGFTLGASGADGDWGRLSDAALRRFQHAEGLVEDGMWTVFVARRVYARLHGG